MPIGPTKTKAQKQKVVHTEMHKFKHGELHSGSKHGPVVKNRKQAIAIAMSESHKSKKGYDRSSHHAGNPGFNRTEKIQSPPVQRNKGADQMGKDSGYCRAEHMKAGVGHGGHESDGGYKPHTGYHSSAEDKGHGSHAKLPSEKHMAHVKKVGHGDNFESEIQEHFPGKGIAGMHKDGTGRPATHLENEKASNDHGRVSGKAEHHHGMGAPHNFPSPSTSGAHGYGHSGAQRHGVFRLSGHPGAHRVGQRGK